MFPFIDYIVSGDRNEDDSGNFLSNILCVWDDDAVNLDDNGGCSFGFYKIVFQRKE